jgi:hypothetical protein
MTHSPFEWYLHLATITAILRYLSPQLSSSKLSHLLTTIMMSKTFLLAIAASLSVAQTIEKNLNFIYSRGDFATIPGPGGVGGEFGHSTGLTITDANGAELYSEDYPGGASPCANPEMELKITSSCWEGEYTFKCSSDNFGNYQSCSVSDGGILAWPGAVDKSIEYVGISISVSGTCGGGFPTGGECGEGATFAIASHNP